MNKNTTIKVLNRDNGAVLYTIAQMNGLRRVFQSGETKQVTFEQLEKLSYLPGGRELLKDSLVILDSPQAIAELLGEVEPEYSYTREDLVRLLKEGSLDEFLDCLDFAPQGVKDLIKTLSVELPLNDVQKRDAILDKLGFNVDNALRIKREIEEDSEPELEKPAQRRVKKQDSQPVRRTVITKKG